MICEKIFLNHPGGGWSYEDGHMRGEGGHRDYRPEFIHEEGHVHWWSQGSEGTQTRVTCSSDFEKPTHPTTFFLWKNMTLRR